MLHTKHYHYPDGLISNRLYTKTIESHEKDLWLPFVSDDDSIKYFPIYKNISPSERAQIWLQRQLDRYAEKRYGMQWLIDRNTNAIIGQCGLLTQEVEGVLELEVGYHIIKEYRGQNYAPEAAKLFIDFAQKNNLADSVISIIDVQNNPSARVAEKNGLKWEKEITWQNIRVNIFRTDSF